MINISPSKTVPIEDFPLAWRWTRETYTLFDSGDLASMRAIDPAASRELQGLLRSKGISRPLAGGNLSRERRLEAHGLEATAVEAWLQRLPIPQSLRVWLCYQWSDALELPWSLFARHWSDFCYPNTDDLVVVPATADWVLEFWHYETLVWYPRPGSPP